MSNVTEAKKHFQLGKMFLQEGQLEKAVEEYKRALVYAPQFPDVHFHLGVAYEYKGAYQEAALQFQKAISLHETYAEAHLHLGVVYFRQRQYERAKKKLHEVLEMDESQPLAYFYLGEAMYEESKSGLGSIEEALPYYQKAIEKDPQLVEPRLSLGKIYRKLGRTEEAERVFQEADRIKRGEKV